MDMFAIEIAGVAISVETMFLSTKEYFRPYLTEKEAEFSVDVTPLDLAREQELLDLEADAEGLKRRKFTDPFLERTVIQRKIADRLIGNDTLLLHGSTVAVDGKAYLFTAPCGTGKSTHTRLWRETFGERAVMVNDDKPFLRLTSDGVLAYGSPWSGKHGLATNICVPLQGICLLHRGEENCIQMLPPMEIKGILRHQLHESTDAALQEKAFALLDRLLETVPTWELFCNKEPEAARMAYDAMHK
ncbi:MAG: hypothetical protein IKU07_01280 [Oscillospiraceae bacterium]|nr:hypothetical protein [Oscillospiraceae bacterium]